MHALEKQLGKNKTSQNKLDLEAYSFDGFGKKGIVNLVVWPETNTDIKQTILYCNRINSEMIIRGNGTNLVGSVTPEKAIVVDMTRMKRIVSYSPDKKEITVQPGITSKELNQFVNFEGLEYSFEDEFSEITTIGAQISYNQISNKSRLGRIKDKIKSISFIDGTGKEYLRENFDELFGAEGTLGVITQATILLDVKKNKTSDLFEFNDKTEVIAKLRELKTDKQIEDVCFFDKKTSALIDLEPRYHLFVQYTNDKGKNDTEMTEKINHKKKAIYSNLRELGFKQLEDPQVSQEKIYDLIDGCEKRELAIYGPIELGVLFVMIPFEQENQITEIRNSWRFLNAKLNGNFGYGLTKKEFVPPGYKHKFIKLKETYDYNNILNRNKLVNFR